MKRKKKELDKKYKGFRYIILVMDIGHRCGYVRIPKGHKIYGMDYSSQTPIKMKDMPKNEPVGKRGVIPMVIQAMGGKKNISLDCLFDVHGGITFANKLQKYRGWWIGFDCAHLGDAKDTSIMSKKYKKFYKKYPKLCSFSDNETIRTTEYVETECKSLIDQVIKYFGDKK